MKILWSPTAIADLVSIRRYIAQDSPKSAAQIAQRIKDAVLRLSQFPLSGREGRVAGTRAGDFRYPLHSGLYDE